jgi:DNA adenine methylase
MSKLIKTISRPPLRYHGGKWRMADKIIPLLPQHSTYAEPFGGGASILLRKSRSKNEIYNDLDGDIVNVFRVMQNPVLAQDLRDKLYYTPFSRAELEQAWIEVENDPVEQARRCLIRSHMGFGSAGATKGRTGFRGFDCYENSYSAPAKQWSELPQYLNQYIDRLRQVVLENSCAFKVIEKTNFLTTLLYVDPPYMIETRSSMKSGQSYYRHEMSNNDHEKLLKTLNESNHMVVLSGYRSELYMDMLKDWNLLEFEARASRGHKGTVNRTECIWIKPNSNRQDTLF